MQVLIRFLGLLLLACAYWSNLAISQEPLRDDQIEFVVEYFDKDTDINYSTNPKSNDYAPNFFKDLITSSSKASREITNIILSNNKVIGAIKQSPTDYPEIYKNLVQQDYTRVRITLQLKVYNNSKDVFPYLRAEFIEYGEVIESSKKWPGGGVLRGTIKILNERLEERGWHKKLDSFLYEQSGFSPKHSTPTGAHQ